MRHINILDGDQIVVGYIEWDLETKYWDIKILEKQISIQTKCLLDCVICKIKHWFRTGRLPYPMPKEDMFPWEDESWDHIRKYLIHWIKLDQTQTL